MRIYHEGETVERGPGSDMPLTKVGPRGLVRTDAARLQQYLMGSSSGSDLSTTSSAGSRRKQRKKDKKGKKGEKHRKKEKKSKKSKKSKVPSLLQCIVVTP